MALASVSGPVGVPSVHEARHRMGLFNQFLSGQRIALCLRSGSSSRGRPIQHNVQAAATSTRISDMSAQMRDMRAQMEENEQLSVLMAGLRGSNTNDDDWAGKDVVMQLINVSDADGEVLPLDYDPDIIADYWGRRPVAVTSRCFQLLSIAGGFLGGLASDWMTGRSESNQVKRAIQLRDIMTSLGPAYIKLGQALSIRPDLLSPAAMNELQKLCDKVPSFDNKVAMLLLESELGGPWTKFYSELSESPIAAASLGQVYKGRLLDGAPVAVKVQRPHVVETVSVDLFIIRSIGIFLRRFPGLLARVDVVALLDEWAARFFEELDYVREGNNATRFADSMAKDLPQVVIPGTYTELTSRRVLTSEWIDGEKLSQSDANDVGDLVNVGVISYLKQLLDTGFFHADPHPGNLIRTPDGRLAILDFGLMCRIDDNIKFGMIEAVSHLIHRDYESIVQDFVTLDFIPPGTDLRPILPVLAKVFDQALEGGGAKNINFQELAADLAQITFDYPFRIPPYFALIIRAIGVLEGIALVGNADFAIVDEAYPYVAQRLLTDDSPRLQAALRYMIYGKEELFDAERVVDLLQALESFSVASSSAQGSPPSSAAAALPAMSLPRSAGAGQRALTTGRTQQLEKQRLESEARERAASSGGFFDGWPSLQLPTPFGPAAVPLLTPAAFFNGAPALLLPPPLQTMITGSVDSWMSRGNLAPGSIRDDSTIEGSPAREALKFMLSPQGLVFREFLMDEVVKSVDALSRQQFRSLLTSLGLAGVQVPRLFPGSTVGGFALTQPPTVEDERVIANVAIISNFLAGDTGTDGAGKENGSPASQLANSVPALLQELAPYLPAVMTQLVPSISERLLSRVTARAVRELYI